MIKSENLEKTENKLIFIERDRSIDFQIVSEKYPCFRIRWIRTIRNA